jgi:hypothetical protein
MPCLFSLLEVEKTQDGFLTDFVVVSLLFLSSFNFTLYSFYSGRAISPSKEIAAGPVIRMWLLVSSHLMLRVPPSIRISLSLERLPVSLAATAVAQAPVPQASVIPLPLSHTRIRIVPSGSIWANSTLHR